MQESLNIRLTSPRTGASLGVKLISSAYRPLETLGLLRVADVPFGGVARSLAACLVSDDVDTFVRKFHQGFEEETSHSSVRLPEPFVFAEYLTFARVVPFEQPSLSADSLGNILTAQVHGEAGYMYHEETRTPLLAVSIPAGMVICGSAPGMIRALESGLRQRLMELREEPLRRSPGRRRDPLNTGQGTTANVGRPDLGQAIDQHR